MLFANLLAIFRKELLSYFTSSFTYIIAGIFWLISGILLNLVLGQLIQGAELARQSGMTSPVDVGSDF
ncbi:MAG: ABC transporter permease, partial [Microcystaceae cyanobacterium]